jgi:hypothetical protein
MTKTLFPRTLLIATSLSLMAAAPVAGAQGGIGTVLFVKGEVVIESPGGQRRPAGKGGRLGPGERLITGKGSMGQVRMTDGGRLSVRPSSDVVFPASAGSGAPRVLELRGGNIRVLNLAAETGSQRPYEVKTPFGTVELADSDALAALGSAVEGGPRSAFVKLNAGSASAASGSGEKVQLVRGETFSVQPAAIRRLQPVAAAVTPVSTRGPELTPDGRGRTPLPFTAPDGLGPVSSSPAVTRASSSFTFPTGAASTGLLASSFRGALPGSTTGGDPARPIDRRDEQIVPPVALVATTQQRLPSVVVSGTSPTLTTSIQDRAVNSILSASLGTDTTRTLSTSSLLTSPTRTLSPTTSLTTTTTTTRTLLDTSLSSKLVTSSFDSKTGSTTISTSGSRLISSTPTLTRR